MAEISQWRSGILSHDLAMTWLRRRYVVVVQNCLATSRVMVSTLRVWDIGVLQVSGTPYIYILHKRQSDRNRHWFFWAVVPTHNLCLNLVFFYTKLYTPLRGPEKGSFNFNKVFFGIKWPSGFAWKSGWCDGGGTESVRTCTKLCWFQWM